MAQKCSCCGKPFTHFEASFHKEANSPPSVAGKCWSCSGASKTFEGAKIEKPNHLLEVFVCLLCIVGIIITWLPIIPILDEPADTPFALFYTKFVAIAYIVLGSIAFLVIKKRGKKYNQKNNVGDPPEERYSYTYGLSSTEYVSKQRFDGSIVTQKVEKGGTELVDNWKWFPAVENGNFFEKLISLWMLPIVFLPYLLYVLAGACFAVWVIPYIFIVLSKDAKSKKQRAKIPHQLRRAYKIGISKIKESPLTYHDKVGFLISRENCTKNPRQNVDTFLASYSNIQADTKQLPFFYKRRNKVPFMIVDYHRDPSKNYGVSFLLMKTKEGDIIKKMVVGNDFVSANCGNWATDWTANGASAQVIQNISWYENKFNSILKSNQKNKEILG